MAKRHTWPKARPSFLSNPRICMSQEVRRIARARNPCPSFRNAPNSKTCSSDAKDPKSQRATQNGRPHVQDFCQEVKDRIEGSESGKRATGRLQELFHVAFVCETNWPKRHPSLRTWQSRPIGVALLFTLVLNFCWAPVRVRTTNGLDFPNVSIFARPFAFILIRRGVI
jgi:hypothetical protein